MKKKTRNILVGCVAAILAVVAGLVVFKCTR